MTRTRGGFNPRVKVLDTKTGIVYPSMTKAAKGLYCSFMTIKNARRGVTVTFDEGKLKFIQTDNLGFEKPVECVETGKRYESIRSAARDLGLNNQAVGRAARDPHRKSGGYHWRSV